jgi:hypothetical protein
MLDAGKWPRLLTLLMWKLIPVKVEPRPSAETAGQEFPPSYEGDAGGQSSTHTQHAESEHDDFGTIVTEVTTVTTVLLLARDIELKMLEDVCPLRVQR